MAVVSINSIRGAVREDLPYGLFSVLDLRTDGRWEGSVQFESLACTPAGGRGGPECDPEAAVIGLPKDLSASTRGELGEASSFTVFGWFNCSPFGFGFEGGQEGALEHLQAREQARVEQAFWTGDLGNTPTLQGATILGGGAVKGKLGLGLLEAWIAKNYGSKGVIHMTRAMATEYGFDKDGDQLVTKLGTPVVAGAGYPGTGPSGQVPTGNQSWIYVTPAMFGYRSEVFTSSARGGDLFDRNTNDLYAIAERNYLLGFDPCGTAAVLIDPTL